VYESKQHEPFTNPLPIRPREGAPSALAIRLAATEAARDMHLHGAHRGTYRRHIDFSPISSGVLIDLGAIKTINIYLTAGTAVLGAGRGIHVASHPQCYCCGRMRGVSRRGTTKSQRWPILPFLRVRPQRRQHRLLRGRHCSGEDYHRWCGFLPGQVRCSEGSGAPFSLVTTFTHRLIPATPISWNHSCGGKGSGGVYGHGYRGTEDAFDRRRGDAAR